MAVDNSRQEAVVTDRHEHIEGMALAAKSQAEDLERRVNKLEASFEYLRETTDRVQTALDEIRRCLKDAQACHHRESEEIRQSLHTVSQDASERIARVAAQLSIIQKLGWKAMLVIIGTAVLLVRISIVANQDITLRAILGM